MIIDQGLDKRSLEIMDSVSTVDYVKTAENEIYEVREELIRTFGEHEVFARLEEAISHLGWCEVNASYRMGIVDGMQIQQEISSMARKS